MGSEDETAEESMSVAESFTIAELSLAFNESGIEQ